MASWTEIPNSSLESGAPIRAVDGVALRDNPIAIAEGATGAPKIQTAGITDLAVTTAKIAASNVTTEKLESGERLTTSNVNNAIKSSSVGAVGTYAFLRPTSSATQAPGSTRSGAALDYGNGSTSPAGTWRCMGHNNGDTDLMVWLRIS